MMDWPLVYIVMVNWNLRQVTLEALESIHSLAYPNFRVVVIDNASQDGSPQAIAGRFAQVEQIINTENRGSTAGYNQGFRHALQRGAQYILLLNNDTIIDPQALDFLVAACASPQVGMVGPLIFYASAPQKIWSAGAQRSRLTLELTGDHGRGQAFSSLTERDFLTTCAVLFKREVFEQAGWMDEDYFVYQEDADYCLRVQRAGFRLLLEPRAKVWHKVSLSSGGSESPTERYWMARNGLLFFRKHARPWQWLFIIPWRLGSALKTSLRLARHGKWPALRAYWRGLRDGITARLGMAGA